LTDKFKDKISMSFVPYSEHVNAGPDLMTAMSTPRVHNWSHCMEFASRAADTQKIIVLMTDGENDKSMRLQDSVYSTANHYAHWASHNFRDCQADH